MKYIIPIIIFALACIAGILIIIFLFRKIVKQKKELTCLEKKKEDLYRQSIQIEKKMDSMEQYTKECQIAANKEEDRKLRAQNDTALIEKYNDKLRYQAEQSGQAYYEKSLKHAQDNLEAALEKEAEHYQHAQAEYQKDYLQAMSDFAAETARKSQEIQKLKDNIKDLEQKQRAAIEANKRAAEEENKKDFYRLQIPDSDLLEVQKLREILPYLRDKDTLNKVIYKIYYEHPTNDLIGRVVGKDRITGIYKITNINNNKVYVGQAISISDRWKQHIKRGLGAEPVTHNKLYPAMQKEGVENFTFEIIEECTSDKLNSREDYWQNYFGAKEYGYSIK